MHENSFLEEITLIQKIKTIVLYDIIYIRF